MSGEPAEKVTKKSVVNAAAQKVDKSTVSVVYRYNRKHDLHIGREMVTFKARERKDIPRAWLKHPDWENEAKNFVVKGV